MSRAVQDYNDGTLSLRAASAHYGIPKSTLADRLRGKIRSFVNKGPRVPAELTRDDELKIHEFIQEQKRSGRETTRSLVKAFASNLAAERGSYCSPCEFGDDWVRSLLLRIGNAAPLKARPKRKNVQNP
jgi:hypothetical protein